MLDTLEGITSSIISFPSPSIRRKGFDESIPLSDFNNVLLQKAETSVTETLMLARLEHLLNNELPISIAEPGMVTLVRPEQPENAKLPMLVTEYGMVTLVKPEHSLNA